MDFNNFSMDCNVFFVEFSQLFSVSSSFDGVRLTFTGFLRGRVILGFEGVLLGLRRAIDATAGDKSVFRGLRHGRYFRWRPASPPKLDAAAEADDSQKKNLQTFCVRIESASASRVGTHRNRGTKKYYGKLR